jgi:hypothetical protein
MNRRALRWALPVTLLAGIVLVWAALLSWGLALVALLLWGLIGSLGEAHVSERGGLLVAIANRV